MDTERVWDGYPDRSSLNDSLDVSSAQIRTSTPAGPFQISEPTNAVVEMLGVRQFEKHVPRVSCGAASMTLIALFGSEPERFAILRAGVSLGNRGTAP